MDASLFGFLQFLDDYTRDGLISIIMNYAYNINQFLYEKHDPKLDVNTVKFLKKCGADITAKDNRLLRFSVVHNNLEMTKFLLENSADVNVKDGFPLQHTIKRSKLKLASLLLDHGADPDVDNGSSLLHAVEKNKTKSAELLLKNGADVNIDDDYLLKTACMYGYLRMVKILLKYGANINTSLGYSPLYSAIENDHTDIAELLINNGADVSFDYRDLVSLAKRNYNSKIVHLLRYAKRQ
jgi:ankyrin repeat protein